MQNSNILYFSNNILFEKREINCTEPCKGYYDKKTNSQGDIMPNQPSDRSLL